MGSCMGAPKGGKHIRPNVHLCIRQQAWTSSLWREKFDQMEISMMYLSLVPLAWEQYVQSVLSKGSLDVKRFRVSAFLELEMQISKIHEHASYQQAVLYFVIFQHSLHACIFACVKCHSAEGGISASYRSAHSL